MEAVKTKVVKYFKEYGITITVLGLKEGISYENPAIQKAIDEKFASEQKLVIQQNENEANLAKAQADAEAVLIEARAQAEANRLLSESLTDKILAKMYYEKWNGILPTVYGDGANTIVQVP
jgi:regulator of protease activity HflC (stomatin/prohibitin superfamily)